ncbi:MAG TPA: hypothetical protein VLE23_03285 [Geminicoccaceae bacterium]|nr:hypothetical protein [Geminicoccaceae bacterium]
MHNAIVLTHLVAARIEPQPWLRPPRRPHRRRQRRSALGRLLVAAGDALQRTGHRLCGAAPPEVVIAPARP